MTDVNQAHQAALQAFEAYFAQRVQNEQALRVQTYVRSHYQNYQYTGEKNASQALIRVNNLIRSIQTSMKSNFRMFKSRIQELAGSIADETVDYGQMDNELQEFHSASHCKHCKHCNEERAKKDDNDDSSSDSSDDNYFGTDSEDETS